MEFCDRLRLVLSLMTLRASHIVEQAAPIVPNERAWYPTETQLDRRHGGQESALKLEAGSPM
jgi:hypothetical protein